MRPLALDTGFSVTRRFLGQVEPGQSSDLSFELGGRIVDLMVDEGDRVAAGEPIARLDTALLDTERARLVSAREALSADLAFAQLSVERREALQERGFTPEESLDQARFSSSALTARIAETDAQIANVDVRIEKAVLRAPFDGRVANRSVDTGATIGAGQTVVTLLEEDAVQIRVGLPLWANIDTDRLWTVTIDGAPYPATLVSVRPDIDPATRTRAVLLRLDGLDVPFGSVAAVNVPREVSATGSWVPLDALRESAPGVWTVLAVDGDNRVRGVPVEVLHTEADRVFVSGGLTDGLPLITGGPHRVTPGQLVDAQPEAL